MTTAFSYIRFSSEKQKSGDSLRRQKELISNWVKSNPDIPLSNDTYEDLGISGYSGEHLNHGLGRLLAAVKQEHIKGGDIILIESIDRAGRLPIEDMIPLLLGIVKKDITIITLEDGQEYNKESISNSAIYVLAGKTQAAHSYSKQLSRKLLSANSTKRDKVINGEAKKLTVQCPWWLEWSDIENSWIERKEKKKIVELIFDMYLKGAGINKITSYLNKNYPEGMEKPVPSDNNQSKHVIRSKRRSNNGWHSSAVGRCLFERRVIGEITSKGEQIKNYYPKVISASTFKKVKDIRAGKSAVCDYSRDKSKPLMNAFHNLVYCVCGELCTYVNKGKQKGQDKVTFMYICKNRMRGICSASNGLNVELIDLHVRPFIHAYEYDIMVKRGYNSISNDNYEDTIKSNKVKFEEVLKNKKKELKRSITAYTEGLTLAEDEKETIKKLKTLRADISDIEMQIEEASEQQFFDETFDIHDLLETNISGHYSNLFLKKHEYKITINNNWESVLTSGFEFNDEKLELLRIKKKGKAVKGSVSTTAFTSNPTLGGGFYKGCFNSDDRCLFIEISNDGKKTIHCEYLFNNTELKDSRANFVKREYSVSYGEKDMIEGLFYVGDLGNIIEHKPEKSESVKRLKPDSRHISRRKEL